MAPFPIAYETVFANMPFTILLVKPVEFEAVREKPLSGGARLLLVVGVGAIMLSYYVFLLIAILSLLALLVRRSASS